MAVDFSYLRSGYIFPHNGGHHVNFRELGGIFSRMPIGVTNLIIERAKEYKPAQLLIIQELNVAGMFVFNDTPEGQDFWNEINCGNYAVYYDKYPYPIQKVFPKEVLYKMCYYQVMQGNISDIGIFDMNLTAGAVRGGFNWENTAEKHEFWHQVIVKRKFNVFYRAYPKEGTLEEFIEPATLAFELPELSDIHTNNKTKTKKDGKGTAIEVSRVIAQVRQGKTANGSRISGRRSFTTVASRCISYKAVSA